MKKLLSSLCATALAASMAVVGVMPANAGPAFVPRAAPEQSDVIKAQTTYDQIYLNKRRNWDGREMRGWRGDRRDFRRDWRGDRRDYRRGWRDREYSSYRGYRGYRDYRPGYRRHGDFWFPAAAFLAGALVTGAIANSGPRYAPGARYVQGGSAHVRWCYGRYRSYRASDNTFQPYNGYRQQCVSPY